LEYQILITLFKTQLKCYYQVVKLKYIGLYVIYS
jgi:hypothetical protein